MATGGLYGSTSTGTVAPQSGSESVGLYGNNTVFGGSYFEWFIFQVVETAPATPTGGSWNFTTNTGTPPTGWVGSPPANPTTTVWVSVGLVNSKSTSSIVWSTPGKFSYAAGLPILSGSGVPSGIGQSDQLYIQTDTTPYSIWFNNATVWTKVTGSSLYADLVSNQTIGGVKTFSSTIQGSVSGTAANVTGTVAIANGGTGGTTAATARTNLGVTATGADTTYAYRANNLSDLASVSTARTNLGVTATGADTTYAYRANNLSDLASVSTARTNLGLGSAAVLTAGAANGVATLDSGGTVPLSQIPASIQGGVSYQGAWNASINSPALTSSVGTKGYYYVVSTAGSTNLNGVTDWNIGDWAIFNGSIWQKIDNTDAVTSVAGRTGTVVLSYTDISGLGTAATTNSTAYATAAQGTKADTAVQTIASADASIIVTTVGTAIDLAVSQTSPASVLVEQVRNTTGATLTKGTAVYISGATGQIPTVSKALATSDATSAQTLGLITTDLANNSNGYVTIIGLISNMNTSAYTDGAQLYLSPITAGTLTATKPYAPQHLVYVAIVAHAHPTQGKLLVKVQNGFELDELHNVSAQTPSNGQTIIWNATTSLWEAANLTAGTGISVTNGAGSVTIANTGVTSVTGTSPVSSSGGATPAISLAASYGDTQNPYASKTANYVLAAPNGTAGVPTFRAIVAADIPTLNQNTTGTAANVTGTVAIANGGSGQTTASAAFNALSPVTTTGDLIVGNGANSATRLGIGTNGYVLTSNGTTATWSASTGGVTSFSAGTTGLTPSTATTGAVSLGGTLAIANGGTGTATPSIVAGTNITVSGTWPNQTINSSASSGATISNDTATSTNVYPLFAAATSGALSIAYTGNTKLLYKPSTGEFQSTAMVSSNGITVNANTVAADYTIATGFNAFSAGPITINSGIAVTIASDSTWVVI